MTEQHIFWATATPNNFKNAKLLDWIEGIGEITTQFELNFIHKFGATYDNQQPERDTVLDLLRPDVLHFALAMEKKLRKHDRDRGGWKGCDIDWLFWRLQEEIKELEDELEDGHPDKESIDVGNFGMMIHSNTAKTTIEGLKKELRQSKAGERK